MQVAARAGFVALVRGDADQAVTLLLEARLVADELGFEDLGALPFRADLVEALLVTGRSGEAVQIAEEAAVLAARSGRPRGRAEAGRALALAAAAAGELAAAEEGVRQALDAFSEITVPFDHARLLLTAGVISRRAGRRTEARARLDEARALFVGLLAAPFVVRADAELARLGTRAADASGLTPTERQVAELVAVGRTNAEVAAELFVSLRTVESNLTRVYRKLGVRSRTELATRLRSA